MEQRPVNKGNMEYPNPFSPSFTLGSNSHNSFSKNNMAEGRKSAILPTKKMDLFPPKIEQKNTNASPLKSNLFSKKLPDFCWKCGKSYTKMKDHIRRAHPEKLDDENKLGALENKLKKVEGEVFRCSTFANSINPGNFNQSKKKRYDSAIGCLVKLNKSFE